MSARLLIAQPYIPQYRVPFFEGLVARLSRADITCVIAAGQPDRLQSQRGDAVQPPWAVSVPTRRVKLGSRSLTFSTARHTWKNSDAIIVGHVGSSVETYRALWDGRVHNKRVGVWGHIKSYVNPAHPLDAALESWQLRQADQIFAYTPGGADFALARGLSEDRVTTVMNSVDTAALTAAWSSVSDEEKASFSSQFGLRPNSTFSFVGGLDSSKRVDFLAAAMDELWRTRPEIKVLVGGTGADEHLLQRAATRGQVVLLGHVDSKKKALMASVSTAILMPGRIGLIAVEALTLQLPILTTAFPFHAPEAEYLREGESRFTSRDDVSSFADLIADFDPAAHGRVASPAPTLERMVENFAVGVERMLSR